jgi:hypothetical protein
MGVRIETRWTDDDGESPGRFHVIVNGQDCGPSVPCELQAWMIMRPRIEMMLQQVCDRSHGIGKSDTQRQIRLAIGNLS